MNAPQYALGAWLCMTAACSCGVEPSDPAPSIVRLDLRLQFSCAVWSDGAAMCWGRGGALGYGKDEGLGNDEPADAWGLIPAGGDVIGAAPAVNANCLAYSDGTVRCWGAAGTGTIGSGSNVDTFVLPEQRPPVSIGGPVIDLFGWSGRVCALLESKDLQCWGFNEGGGLGYGHTNNIGDDELPSEVGPVLVGAKVEQLAMGSNHSCALLEGGTVKCWGHAQVGQLGRGSEENIGDDEYRAHRPRPVARRPARRGHPTHLRAS